MPAEKGVQRYYPKKYDDLQFGDVEAESRRERSIAAEIYEPESTQEMLQATFDFNGAIDKLQQVLLQCKCDTSFAILEDVSDTLKELLLAAPKKKSTEKAPLQKAEVLFRGLNASELSSGEVVVLKDLCREVKEKVSPLLDIFVRELTRELEESRLSQEAKGVLGELTNRTKFVEALSTGLRDSADNDLSLRVKSFFGVLIDVANRFNLESKSIFSSGRFKISNYVVGKGKVIVQEPGGPRMAVQSSDGSEIEFGWTSGVSENMKLGIDAQGNMLTDFAFLSGEDILYRKHRLYLEKNVIYEGKAEAPQPFAKGWMLRVDRKIFVPKTPNYRGMTYEIPAEQYERWSPQIDDHWCPHPDGVVTIDHNVILLNGEEELYRGDFDEWRAHPDGIVIRVGNRFLLNGKELLYEGPFDEWKSGPNGIGIRIGDQFFINGTEYICTDESRYTDWAPGEKSMFFIKDKGRSELIEIPKKEPVI